MTIYRAATTGDFDAIARIWIDGWLSNGIALASEPDYLTLRARIDREVAGGWQIIVADQTGVVVGFVAMSPDKRVLEQIFIDPVSHRQGIGAGLLAQARAVMPQGFTLWTHGDNHGAAAFYEAMGMALVSAGMHPKNDHAIRTYRFGPLAA